MQERIIIKQQSLLLACCIWVTSSVAVAIDKECLTEGMCDGVTIEIGSSNSFPPINFLDAQGELDGFGRELSDAVFSSLGITIERKHSSLWTDVVNWLESGEIDLIHDTGYAPDREKYFDFSDPIISMPEVIYVREDRVDIQTLSSLYGKKVACVNNHITHLYLKTFPEIECHIVRRPIEGLTALLAGDVDAFIYPKEIILYFLQQQRLTNKVKVVGEPIRHLTWSMTVKKGNADILMLVNNGLQRIHSNGEYVRIYNKWFGQRFLSGYSKQELVYIIAISIFLTVLVLLSIGLFFYYRKTYENNVRLGMVIEQLQEAQSDLQESDKRYEEMGHNIPGAIYQFKQSMDGSYSLPFISDGIESIIGIPGRELVEDVGLLFLRVPDDVRAQIYASIEQSANELSPWRFDFPVDSEDGARVWLRGSSIPTLNQDRSITWNGILLDITSLHMIQEERDLFFKLSIDFMCIANFEGYFTDLSQAWEETLGFSKQELMSKPFIDFVHEDDIASTLEAANQLGEKSNTVVDFKNRYKCKDGRYRWLSWNAVSVHENQAIYATAHDITDLVEIENALKGSKDELEIRVKERTKELQNEINERVQIQKQLHNAKIAADNSNHAKSRFLSQMSHELRTPLNAILGFSQIIELEYVDNSELLDNVKEISGAGRHLLDLINEILDLAKIEAGEIDVRIESVVLNEIVDACVTFLKPIANKRNVELVYQQDDFVGVYVHADKIRLKQIILNLISNAIKYNIEGGKVILSAVTENGMCRISIADTGIGIPENMHSRLFQPFERLGADIRIEGTGIGLTISKQLVEKMDGDIAFESEPGKGTCFTFGIPLSIS